MEHGDCLVKWDMLPKYHSPSVPSVWFKCNTTSDDV